MVHTVELLDWATGGPKPEGLESWGLDSRHSRSPLPSFPLSPSVIPAEAGIQGLLDEYRNGFACPRRLFLDSRFRGSDALG